MDDNSIKVLLVEYNPDDAILIREALGETGSENFHLEWVARLSEGLNRLDQGGIDVVLLDMSLPDSQGLDTFKKAYAAAPNTLIIILSGLDDERTASDAAQQGAQDYLVKSQVDSPLLVRSLRYAIERHRLRSELEQRRQREQQQRELSALEQLSGPSQTSVTAQTFGLEPLRVGLPDTFNELVQRYEELMDLALERRTHKVEHNVSESLRAVVEQLGFLKAGPRDVVEIHATALKSKTREATQAKAQAYAEEGRLMVLELMGYLVSFYRNYSSGVGMASAPEASNGVQYQSIKGEIHDQS